MIIRHTLTALVTAVALLSATGCAVTRDQQTAGAYVDDTVITTQVKSRMLNDKDVAGTSISGAWTLKVTDGSGQDTGTFVGWTLHLAGS